MNLNELKKEELVALIRYIEKSLKRYNGFKEKTEKEGVDKFTVYQYLGYCEQSIEDTLEAIQSPAECYIINLKIYESNKEYQN